MHFPFTIAWVSEGVCFWYEVALATVTFVAAPGPLGPSPLTAMVLPVTDATVP